MAQDPKPPSERSFGFVLTGLLAILGLLPILSGGHPRLVLVSAAGTAALISMLAPSLLRPFNLVWHRFGLLLHRIVSPIVLGATFFIVVTPIGLVARASGKNLLQIKKPERSTYWLPRTADDTKRGAMRDQF